MLLPVWKLNVNDPGATWNVDVPPELTFRITGTVMELLPDVTVMKPAYAPVAIAPGFTETERTCGVFPDVGVTPSQFPLENEVTANVAAEKFVEVTSRFCAGVALPLVLNVS
jgi:hypothetical protein